MTLSHRALYPSNSIRHSLSVLLDKLFSHPFLYTVFALVCLRPRALMDLDALIASVLHLPAFPLFKVLTYVFFTAVFVCYVLRWLIGAIQRKNPTLLCITGMFLALAVITFVFDGASGYHIDWHAGFALMMMIDMGLQRERGSLVRALTGALECWVYLNLFSFLIFPNSLLPGDPTAEWLLGNRAFYYRTVLPALGMALIRCQVCGKQYKTRTALLLIACMLTIAHQQGGTALIGTAVLGALLLWCNRRALPRYITPLLFVLLSAAVLVGIQYFDLHNLFGYVITDVLGKSMTLSNRTVIWEQVLDVIWNNPVTGIGYLPVAFMRDYLGSPSFSHTHNQLLELMLHGGLIAVTLYLLAVGFASREALKHRRSAAAKTMALLLCAFAVMGISEIFHNDPIYYALIVFLSRSDCLDAEVKQLPRISLLRRIKRDIKKRRPAAA